ncbi:PBECR3 domain-containing polyvalent protein [Emticicia agri]|uniref:Phage-Barnase-EndoU-ColicinE5/D-RelE like nuclease 3 domain-containing protein n=1 Tax=Emticicia agri TaxID=2492393 RepID=A0A4V1ZC85_9BACT|nr:hypothetical protein [Emticicia agri]RYU91780.1 hypothetical protein EWM59_26820 [Emticicia agri]
MVEITQEIKQQIYDLYDECLENLSQFHRKIDLFIVPDKLAAEIFEKTSIDVTGYWVCLDNYEIIHAMEEHGNPITEAKRGQIALEREDFVKMLEVFLNPEEINTIGTTRHTQKTLLQFIRKIEDKTYVVKEVRSVTSKKKNKVSRLVFHTMYKIKAIKLA